MDNHKDRSPNQPNSSPKRRWAVPIDGTEFNHDQFSQLNPAWREVVRLRLMGWNRRQIARTLGLAVETVTRLLRNPDVAAHLDSLHDRLDEEVIRAMVYNPMACMGAGRPRAKAFRRRKLTE